MDGLVGDEAELHAWLVEHGAAPGAATAAIRAGHAEALVSDVILTGGAHASARDLAMRHGVDVSSVVGMFHDLGVAVPDPDEPLFTDADADLAETMGSAKSLGILNGVDVMRVIAGSLERIAEAAVAVYVQGQEEDLKRRRASVVECAESNMRATGLALAIGTGLGPIFRHHLRQAVARQRVMQEGVSAPEMARLVVGFVDLVESTAMQADLDPVALGRQVSRFEARAFDVTSAGGGRLVKFIGDEIMVAAPDPVAGCRIVVDLIDAFTEDGTQPRAGLVHGEVLFRHGDYYGPVVNLAARLVDAAIPGEALVDVSVVEAVKDESLAFESAGRRMVKGFAAPVAVWTLTSDP